MSDPAGALANWTTGTNPCGGGSAPWPGMKCDEWGMVVGLDLSGMQLRGPLSAEIAAVENLAEIDLSDNMMSGRAGGQWCSTCQIDTFCFCFGSTLA